MNSEHRVPLRSLDTVFSPDWGYGCVLSAYAHELYGPETLMVRALTLNTLTWARYQIAADLPYPIQDRRHKANRSNVEWK